MYFNQKKTFSQNLKVGRTVVHLDLENGTRVDDHMQHGGGDIPRLLCLDIKYLSNTGITLVKCNTPKMRGGGGGGFGPSLLPRLWHPFPPPRNP